MRLPETLQQGIARISSHPHTQIVDFLQAHFNDPTRVHRDELKKWWKRKSWGTMFLDGEILLYDGATQLLVPGTQDVLQSGQKILYLHVDDHVTHHPSELSKLLLQDATWYATDSIDFIVLSSWQPLMERLVQLAPAFTVVGLLDDQKIKSRIIEKQHNFRFPVVAANPIILYESITGKPFPDMSD